MWCSCTNLLGENGWKEELQRSDSRIIFYSSPWMWLHHHQHLQSRRDGKRNSDESREHLQHKHHFKIKATFFFPNISAASLTNCQKSNTQVVFQSTFKCFKSDITNEKGTKFVRRCLQHLLRLSFFSRHSTQVENNTMCPCTEILKTTCHQYLIFMSI